MLSDNSQIIADLKALGVSAAAVFPTNEIRFDPVYRGFCKQNLCGRYGKNYMCPPANGEIEELKADALSYETAVLIQTIHNIEDSFDFEGMEEGGAIHNENILKAGEYIHKNLEFGKMLILGAGGCTVCPKCAIVDKEPCRFPEKAISSVEGYCMDVSDMTNSHGLRYINGENTVSYVAVFLLKN